MEVIPRILWNFGDVCLSSPHNEEEAGLLEREAAEKVFLGEDELAKGMSRHVLERYGKVP